MDITELKAIIDANIFENTSQAITGDVLNDVLNLIADSLGEYVPAADIFDEAGTIRSALLPSYVDDVLEFSTRDDFPAVGEGGKIYLAADTNLSYRWGGSEYVIIAQSLALGETSSTAYRGDRGKIAYDHSQTSHRLSIAGLEVSALGGSIDTDALASALSIPELRTAVAVHIGDGSIHITADERTAWNKFASYFYIDEETGNLVTDRNVIIRKNLTVGGDTSTGGKGEDTGVSGTVTGIRVDANTILEPTNGIVDMSDVLANIDVDLSNYYTKQETISEIAKAVDGLNLGQYAKASELATLQTEVDNIEAVLGMDEEAAGIINTWEEVKAFLDGYSSSDDLATILSAMNADIAKRALASDLDALALTVGDNATNIRNLKASVYTKDDLAAYKSWWDDLMGLIVKEGNDIKIKTNLTVTGDTTTGGTGSDAGTSGTVIGVVVNGKSYEDETNGMLDLSTLMNQYALTSAIPSLEGYAKIADVSAALAGYQPLITASNKLDYSLIANTPAIPTAASLGLKNLAFKDSLSVSEIVGLQSALSNKQDVLGYAPIPRNSDVSDYSVWNDSDWGFSTWSPSSQGIPNTDYGTSFNFRDRTTWYFRLMFGANGRIYHYSGINTTTMTNRGTLAYLSDIPTNNNQLTNGAGYITSSGSCAYATNAGNADTLDGYHANYFQPLSTAINTSNIGSQSVNYATNAGNADTLDGVHNGELTAKYFSEGKLLTRADTINKLMSGIYCYINGDNPVGSVGDNTILLSFRNYGRTDMLQIANDSNEHSLYYRCASNIGNSYEHWSNWRTFAFTDSNVASARALTHSNGTVGAVVSSSGDVTINNNIIVKGDTATGSDIRFKDIIKDHRIALESIAQAPLFTFKWKDRDDDTIHLGTSAQYWEDVAPWLVKGTDFKVLDYSTLGVAIGISLANKTVNLEERVKILEKENEQLKKQIYGS